MTHKLKGYVCSRVSVQHNLSMGRAHECFSLWPDTYDIFNRISLRLWEMRHSFFPGVKHCGVKLTSHSVIVLRLSWVTTSLPHIPSWHWQKQFTFTFCLFLGLIY